MMLTLVTAMLTLVTAMLTLVTAMLTLVTAMLTLVTAMLTMYEQILNLSSFVFHQNRLRSSRLQRLNNLKLIAAVVRTVMQDTL